MVMGVRHAVLVDQADCIAFRRRAARHGHFVARCNQGQGRQPTVVNGIKQSPIEGVSMMYTFDKAHSNDASRHKTQYFEMFGDRALYHDGWIASTKVIRPPWV